MADADSLAAALAGIRGRSADVATAFATGRGGNAAARESAPDVPRLLAAVEAALRLADRAKPVTWWNGTHSARAWTLDPDELREAITRALLGEETPDGS